MKIQNVHFKIMLDKNYSENGDARHYDQNRINAIVKFERTYGTIALMVYCEINADKYRERIGKKDGQSIEQDLVKMQWYEKAAKFYFDKLGTESEIVINNRIKEPLPWKTEKQYI